MSDSGEQGVTPSALLSSLRIRVSMLETVVDGGASGC